MSTKKVTLVYSLKNTFVQRDIALLEKMGYQVLTLQAPPVKHFFGFLWNRLREFFLGFFSSPKYFVSELRINFLKKLIYPFYLILHLMKMNQSLSHLSKL